MNSARLLRTYIILATEKTIFRRALRVALIVGIILNLINNPSLFHSFSFHEIHFGRILLTFLVPYGVSTYSSVLSNSKFNTGDISQLNATLHCKNCKKSDLRISIGQKVEECPNCISKTNWKLKSLD